MKLPKCPCRSTVIEIWSTIAGKHGLDTFGQAEFNGTGCELQCATTTSESSSAAVKFQQLTCDKTVTPGSYGWSEMEEGVMGNKIQLLVSPKIRSGFWVCSWVDLAASLHSLTQVWLPSPVSNFFYLF